LLLLHIVGLSSVVWLLGVPRVLRLVVLDLAAEALLVGMLLGLLLVNLVLVEHLNEVHVLFFVIQLRQHVQSLVSVSALEVGNRCVTNHDSGSLRR